jgi:hypothetical protein
MLKSTSSNCLSLDGSVHLERRNSFDRRKNDGRRSQKERRLDNRMAPVKPRKTLKTWVLSLVHLRLGVDRRKENDRRKNGDRRNGALLTQEEIADLLS